VVKKLELMTGTSPLDDEPMPQDLGEHGARLWQRVQREYRIIDCGGVELLRQMCRALDRAERCRALIDREGEVVRSKHGPREHPLLKIEATNRSLVARLIRSLGLDVEPVRPSVGRPPTFGGV
jgi:hypothetical protein